LSRLIISSLMSNNLIFEKRLILLTKNLKSYKHNMDNRKVFLFVLFLCHFTFSICLAKGQKTQATPNIIVILADDLGYGDLSCFGHPTIQTPNLNKMATEGVRLTQFYVGANVCTPSRAALLTGRLPVRSGMAGHSRVVLFPDSKGGLPASEITIAKALKTKGYATACIGKWHLGHLQQYLPANHGFDYYFGIPYSNDMRPNKTNNYPPLPLYKDSKVIEENPDQQFLTGRYTVEALAFIEKNKNKPFFLYYSNNFPHVPLYASDKFKGKSKRGLYGDVVSELDWSVGQLLNKLKELKLDGNTLVIFTSDNGPWLTQKQNGGSAGLLFEGKGSDYEGGMRVPAIAWWPGTIPANQLCTSPASAMDLFPTFLKLAGVDIPKDRAIDGQDIMPLLTGLRQETNEVIYYYNLDSLYAVRKGAWKAHFTSKYSYSKEPAITHNPPLLYNLENDPSEKFDLSKDHSDVVDDLRDEFIRHLKSVKKAPPQY